MGDGVATLADLDDGAGLDSRGGFITVGVDASKEVLYYDKRVFVSYLSCSSLSRKSRAACDLRLAAYRIILTFQGHRLECRVHRDLLRSGKLHLLFGATIDPAFSHDD